MKAKNLIKVTLIASALALLSGCQDPITAALVKLNDTVVKDRSNALIPDVLIADAKPSKNSFVKTYRNYFIEADSISKLNGVNSVSLTIVAGPDMDHVALTEEITKVLKSKNIEINPNSKPLIINVSKFGEKSSPTEAVKNSMAGVGGLAGSMGATVMESVGAEVAGRFTGKENEGIAREISYSISFNGEVKNIRFAQIYGTNIESNAETTRIRDQNQFCMMIAKSVSELI